VSASPLIGVITGTGLYELEGLAGRRTEDVETPYGTATVVLGDLDGVPVAHVPRHGVGHARLSHVVAVCNENRGLPWAAVVVGILFLVLTYVLNRTRFGRHVYAVGGNAEAARRAGVNVDRVKIWCFALCSLLAVIGGVILASRLRSVDTNTGGGQALLYPIAAAVIGGTSLFGGRGTMKAALLGALVMLSIDNGLGLLGLSSGTKFVLTGAVLLLAVTVDSISRRGRAQSGRA
jgi:D-xylose transport system permease protein